MRHPVTIVLTLLLVISATAASAADQSVWDQCNQTGDTDASITACTQIVQAPGETASDRAVAYYIRGGAYQTKGDSDRAIATLARRSRSIRGTPTRLLGAASPTGSRAIPTAPSRIIAKRSRSIRGYAVGVFQPWQRLRGQGRSRSGDRRLYQDNRDHPARHQGVCSPRA